MRASRVQYGEYRHSQRDAWLTAAGQPLCPGMSACCRKRSGGQGAGAQSPEHSQTYPRTGAQAGCPRRLWRRPPCGCEKFAARPRWGPMRAPRAAGPALQRLSREAGSYRVSFAARRNASPGVCACTHTEAETSTASAKGRLQTRAKRLTSRADADGRRSSEHVVVCTQSFLARAEQTVRFRPWGGCTWQARRRDIGSTKCAVMRRLGLCSIGSHMREGLQSLPAGHSTAREGSPRTNQRPCPRHPASPCTAVSELQHLPVESCSFCCFRQP